MNTIEAAAPKVVSRQEWIAARKQLLAKEKAFTRQRDELSRERRELPWVKIDKEYTFDAPGGKVTLRDLFAGRTQLIVYHFMFGPDWEAGCSGCSFLCDHVDSARQHFEHADISFAAVSRAPLDKILPYRERMGWTFAWVSSYGTDFNYDFHATASPAEMAKGEMYYNYETIEIEPDNDEHHALSVFHQDEAGQIYHTYSLYVRGGEDLINTYRFIDLTPKGRTLETGPMSWMKRHDEY